MKLILFDLDGTLYSSRNILPSAYEEGIKQFNRAHSTTVEVPSDRKIFAGVGNPVDEIYEELFPTLSADDRSDLQDAVFSSLLKKILDKKGAVFDGVRDVLKRLNRNRLLGLVTNAQTRYMDAVLDTHELREFFGSPLCNDDAPSGEKSELVAMQLDRFQVDSDEALLVGDRHSDLQAARTHGLYFLGCTYGYGSNELFDEEGIETLEDIGNLPDRVETLTATEPVWDS